MNECMARPKSVNLEDPEVIKQIQIFGSLAATQQEIAGWFGVSVRTIQRYFDDEESEFCRVYKKALSQTCESLRRTQLKKAQGGDSAMLVWLGKQLLNQHDKREISTDTKSWHDLVKDVSDEPRKIEN
jgi:hypothetical protein